MIEVGQYSTIVGWIKKSTRYWILTTIDEFGQRRDIHYVFFEGAHTRWLYEERAAYYRIRAREIIPTINLRTLTIKESSFVNKMIRINCKGMSKKMYGYLKGIQERNFKGDSNE
jgi:hypothetical protein